MPIRSEHRFFYPIDWPQLSAVIRFGRAKGCCEGCGRPHGRMVYHLGDGRWWDAEAGRWRDGSGRRIRIAAEADILGQPAEPKWFWPPRTGITTPRTTRTPTSRPSASDAT